MFKYNLDEIIYIPNKKICFKGWYSGNDNLILFLDNDKYILKRNISRTDVLENTNISSESDVLGFEIDIDLDKSLEKIVIVRENDNKELVTYYKSDLEKLKSNDTIMYSIDSVEKIDDNIKIKGWAFSKFFNDIKIQLDSKLDYNIKFYDRLDVNIVYKNIKNIEKCGFEIYINNNNLSKKINILFSDECSTKKEIISKKMLVSKNTSVSNFIIRNLNSDNIKKGIIHTKQYGIKSLIDKIKYKTSQSEVLYKDWLIKNTPTKEELDKQRDYKFEINPLISVIVPTYNTPEFFLREMIESVINQTYSNWELCIADGSNESKTKDILKEYSNLDNRIKLKYLEKNEGISGNTNKALELATGDYIGLFDHDDLLTQDALYEVVKCINDNNLPDFIYTDEDKVDENSESFFDPHFKPDFSPDTLRSYNYITHFSVFKKSLLDKVGNFRSEFDGSQDYDLILRLTEIANGIVHIPKVLYHWRVHKGSVASGGDAKPYAYEAAKKALKSHLDRVGLNGNVYDGKFLGSYKIDYTINNNPRVSIIIPNKDHMEDLKKCINSILDKTTYKNYEIIVVENNSESKEIFEYYDTINKNDKIKVLNWDSEFNYSAINNFGVKNSSGEYIILLNNDIEIISNNWIEEMLMLAQRDDVGAVGAKLYYPDDTIQHAGVILSIGGVAAHSHKYISKINMGYFGRAVIVQNLSAVTAACLMVKKSIFYEVEGLDEEFKVSYNDIDFCMKIRKKGYLITFTPYAEMYHYESKSRGSEDTDEKKKRFEGEVNRFRDKWGFNIEDPYYNINLTLDKEDFSLRIN